jgi:hypothetical protein
VVTNAQRPDSIEDKMEEHGAIMHEEAVEDLSMPGKSISGGFELQARYVH